VARRRTVTPLAEPRPHVCDRASGATASHGRPGLRHHARESAHLHAVTDTGAVFCGISSHRVSTSRESFEL